MSISYQFCVTRRSEAKIEKFGVEYGFGDIDPGKEAARVLVSSKYKEANTTNLHVSDYDANNCGAIRDEFNVKMTGEQVQHLGEALAAGNAVEAAAVAIEIGAGVTQRSISDAGKLVGIGGGNAIPVPPILSDLPKPPAPPAPPHIPDLPKPPKPPGF